MKNLIFKLLVTFSVISISLGTEANFDGFEKAAKEESVLLEKKLVDEALRLGNSSVKNEVALEETLLISKDEVKGKIRDLFSDSWTSYSVLTQSLNIPGLPGEAPIRVVEKLRSIYELSLYLDEQTCDPYKKELEYSTSQSHRLTDIKYDLLSTRELLKCLDIPIKLTSSQPLILTSETSQKFVQKLDRISNFIKLTGEIDSDEFKGRLHNLIKDILVQDIDNVSLLLGSLRKIEEFIPNDVKLINSTNVSNEIAHLKQHFLNAEIKLTRPKKKRGSVIKPSGYVTDFQFLWPKGIVPIVGLNEQNMSKVQKKALEKWESAGEGAIRFVNWRSDVHKYGVIFIKGTVSEEASGDCQTDYIGLPKFGETLNEITCTDFNTESKILHEIGHVLGFAHEHQRPDRDNFIKIHKEFLNLKCASEILSKIKDDRFRYPRNKKYDFNSIMHYPAYACIKSGANSATITRLNGDINISGQNLSDLDIETLKFLYGTPDSPSVPLVSPPPGNYYFDKDSPLEISIRSNLKVFYTDDGSTPNMGSKEVKNNRISLNEQRHYHLKFRAISESGSMSKIGDYHYRNIDLEKEKVNIKPGGAIYKEPQKINLETNELFDKSWETYFSFGENPAVHGIKYDGNLWIYTTQRLRAIRMNASAVTEVSEEKYEISLKNPLLPVMVNPQPGKYKDSVQLTMSSPDGHEIFYTTDGTMPHQYSSRYRESVTLTNDADIYAVTIDENSHRASKVSLFSFKVGKELEPGPSASPSGGTFEGMVTVTLSSNSPGNIYWTWNLDGGLVAPYTRPINVIAKPNSPWIGSDIFCWTESNGIKSKISSFHYRVFPKPNWPPQK